MSNGVSILDMFSICVVHLFQDIPLVDANESVTELSKAGGSLLELGYFQAKVLVLAFEFVCFGSKGGYFRSSPEPDRPPHECRSLRDYS
jgi:hypothetical protein